MKFKNIKVGDKVVVSKSISLGWNSSKSFNIVTTVTKTTKTQFTADGNRYRKDYGGMIGNNWVEAEVYIDDSQDQSKEMARFQKKLDFSRYIKKSITDMMQDINKKNLYALDLPYLDDLKNQVNKLKDLIKE